MDRSKSTSSLGEKVVQDFLSHFGVKGMHWGVRRSQVQLSADAQRAKDVRQVHKTSGKAALSNRDLQDFISRMNLERQFDQFTPSGQARTFVIDFLKSEGKSQAKTFGKAQVAKAALG